MAIINCTVSKQLVPTVSQALSGQLFCVMASGEYNQSHQLYKLSISNSNSNKDVTNMQDSRSVNTIVNDRETVIRLIKKHGGKLVANPVQQGIACKVIVGGGKYQQHTLQIKMLMQSQMYDIMHFRLACLDFYHVLP